MDRVRQDIAIFLKESAKETFPFRILTALYMNAAYITRITCSIYISAALPREGKHARVYANLVSGSFQNGALNKC